MLGRILQLLLLSAVANSSFDFSTCGKSKTCAGTKNCDGTACLAGSFVVLNRSHIIWEITGPAVQNDGAFVAVAISFDTKMGDDYVIECSQLTGEKGYSVKLSYNTAKNGNVSPKNVRIHGEENLRPSLVSGAVATVENGFVYCSATIRHDGKAGNQYYSLTWGELKYLLLAAGKANSAGLQTHYGFQHLSPNDDEFISIDSIPIKGNGASQCMNCAVAKLWLDIMFVVDSSASITRDGIDDVTSKIKSLLLSLKMSKDRMRAGIVVYSDKTSVAYPLGSISSEAAINAIKIEYIGGRDRVLLDAFTQAVDEFERNQIPANPRRVVVVFSSGFSGDIGQLHALALNFKDNIYQPGIIITNDYNYYANAKEDEALAGMASPGYKTVKNNAIVAQLQGALCDANCYCPTGSQGFTGHEICMGRCTPSAGCFKARKSVHGQVDAQNYCKGLGGTLASIHDADTQLFVTDQFPVKTKFWIGLNASAMTWSDGTPVDYTLWGPSQPMPGQSCAYSQQYQGFKMGWFADECLNGYAAACHIKPCSSTNVCRAAEMD